MEISRLRMLMEAALDRNDNLFGCIDAIPDAVLVFELESRRIYNCNSKAENIFGVQLNLAADNPVYIDDFVLELGSIHPPDWDAFTSELNKNPDGMLKECLMLMRDGSTGFFEAGLRRIEVDSRILCLMSARDISRRKSTDTRYGILDACLLSFANDARENIDQLIAVCGTLFMPAFILYLTRYNGLTEIKSQWNKPKSLVLENLDLDQLNFGVLDSELFEITRGMIKESHRQQFLKGGLPENFYPLEVVGKKILCGPEEEGALCLFYSEPYMAQEEDHTLFTILANALGVEEGRLQAEAALKKSNSALKVMNQQLKDQQAQLVQSEKMASIGQLAAGVAHEINNPIGYIRSNIDTLSDYANCFKRIFSAYSKLEKTVARLDLGDTEISKFLADINNLKEEEELEYILEDLDSLVEESRDGTIRVAEIVSNLKSFARVDETERKLADINQGIQSTLKIVWNELKYKCQVHTDLQPLPQIVCRPGQLNQVFMNIILNATHAIEKSGDIWINSRFENESIVVEIRDNGSGIKEENLPRLFDPFFTTKEVGKGTGLGLSISHGIIIKHNGSIDVTSKTGEGTTFCIRLPLGDFEPESIT